MSLRIVAAIVTSPVGVLVGRRIDGVPPWTFLGGHIEPGESSAEAAVREVEEEAGLRVEVVGQELGWRVHPVTGRTMIYLACQPVGDSVDVLIGAPGELAEVKWASLAEVEELLPGLYPPVLAHLRRRLHIEGTAASIPPTVRFAR